MKSLAMLALSVLFMGATTDSTPTAYTIQDASSQSLGLVTLMSATGGVSTVINGPGIYLDTLDAQATAIVVAGRAVDYPNTGTVTLPNGHKLQISWATGANAIVVTDQDEY